MDYWPVFAFFAVQTIGAIIWGIRLEGLTKALANETGDKKKRDEQLLDRIFGKIDLLDGRLIALETTMVSVKSTLDPQAVANFRREFAMLMRDVFHLEKAVDRLRNRVDARET
jgi:hypothetical protein